MPDDTIEGVAEHSCRLQPSINLHAHSLYVQLLWYNRKSYSVYKLVTQHLNVCQFVVYCSCGNFD